MEKDTLETGALDDAKRQVLSSNPFDEELIQCIGLSNCSEHTIQDILSVATFGVDVVHCREALRSGGWPWFITRYVLQNEHVSNDECTQKKRISTLRLA